MSAYNETEYSQHASKMSTMSDLNNNTVQESQAFQKFKYQGNSVDFNGNSGRLPQSPIPQASFNQFSNRKYTGGATISSHNSTYSYNSTNQRIRHPAMSQQGCVGYPSAPTSSGFSTMTKPPVRYQPREYTREHSSTYDSHQYRGGLYQDRLHYHPHSGPYNIREPESSYDSLGSALPTPLNNEYTELCDMLYSLTYLEKCQKIGMNYEQIKQPNVCEHITRDKCDRYWGMDRHHSATVNQNPEYDSIEKLLNADHCADIHFKPVYGPNTQHSLGQCSFLNLCHRRLQQECKYVHYEQEDFPDTVRNLERTECLQTRIRSTYDTTSSEYSYDIDEVRQTAGEVTWIEANQDPMTPKAKWESLPPQWICGDIRKLRLDILGSFGAILVDPPWDIHMELPYGTMKDDEMRSLKIGELASATGPCLMFLWVTGRTKELAIDLLREWGFAHTDVVIWCKTNQLNRVVRTGRTGHWLNHGKEHCLIGIRGPPPPPCEHFDPDNKAHAEYVIDNAIKLGWLRHSPYGYRDIIVSKVRETSRKPDEMYYMIQTMCPGARKVELFGRMNNVRKGWLTIGNQLDGTEIHETELIHAYLKEYATNDFQQKLAKSRKLRLLRCKASPKLETVYEE